MCGQRALGLKIARLLQIVGRCPASSVRCAGCTASHGRRHVDDLKDVTVGAARRALEVCVGVARAGGSHHWHRRDCEAEGGSKRLQANRQAGHGTLVLVWMDATAALYLSLATYVARSSCACVCACARGIIHTTLDLVTGRPRGARGTRRACP